MQKIFRGRKNVISKFIHLLKTLLRFPKCTEFPNSSHEKKFKISKISFQLTSYRMLTLTLIILSSAIFFSNPLRVDLMQAAFIIPFISAILLLILGYFVISKKFAFRIEKAILLIVVLFIIGSGEMAKGLLQENEWSPGIYYIFGINLQMGCMYLIVARVNWIECSVAVWITQSYIWFRVLEKDKKDQVFKPAVITYCVYSLILPLLSYFGEKEDRKHFMEVQSREENLEAFKVLIKDFLPSSVVLFDERTEVKFFNEKIKEMFNTSHKGELLDILETIQIEKKTMTDFSFDGSKNPKNVLDLVRSWPKLTKHSKSSEKFYNFEGNMVLHEENKEFSFAIQIGTTIWEGLPAVMIIINDITRIKNYYKELSLHKDHLLATVSHDLRTPLNAILGMLEVVLDQVEDRAIHEKLEIIQTSSNLLLSMINDILDFSLLNEGKLKLQYEERSVIHFLNDTIKILALPARLKGLDLSVDTTEIRNPLINTDPRRLQQILLNLIGNAIKYTEQGNVTVRIKEVKELPFFEPKREKISLTKAFLPIKQEYSDIHIEEEEPTFLRAFLFEVEDTGIGIPREDFKSLFKLFGRLNNGPGGIGKNGVGLGLAISQNLVRRLNETYGDIRIEVESQVGVGSRFFFYIVSPYIGDMDIQSDEFDKMNPKCSSPFSKIKKNYFERDDANAKSPKYLTKKEKSANPSPTKRVLNVLAVDDDQINLLVIKNYLENYKHKYLLKTANHGKDALDTVKLMLQKGQFFDIFLMDCNMPIMDGYEASRNLKVMMEEGLIPRVPIIAVTANVSAQDKQLCQEKGMDFFLSKPLRKADFLSEMKKALKTTKENPKNFHF